jgi:acyl-CoA synthetase (AMP-forming)/AMP-acid ligase II
MQNNIGLFLTKRAHLSPTLEAFIDDASGRRLTYADWNAGANRAAHALSRMGIVKGDRVALLMLNCPEFFECYFGLAKLGAVVVPLNIRLVADELAFILKDSGAMTLIYGEEFADTVEDLQGRGADGTSVRHWIHVAAPDGGVPCAAFAEDFHDLRAGAADTEPTIGAEEDDVLYILYTSGTTGLPKGAVHTHNSSIWACVTLMATAEMRYRDRYLLLLPAYHVGALTPLTLNVQRGVTNVAMRSFNPLRAWQLIDAEKITVALAVPAMLMFMDQVPGTERFDCSRLRWIMSGAAPVPITLSQSFAARGIEVHEVYGLTECCGPACLISPEDALERVGSTGKACFHTEVRVVDEAGHDVAPDEPGEVVIRGKHNMTGYWNLPEATAESIRDGWLYTGDVASIDSDGFIYIRDRTKDMIISGGENVYPAEVENVILSHPEVREVAVIGQPSARWGESPLAVVVPSDPALQPADVIGHCVGKMARFKLPKAVAFIDEIPRNPTGKVLKRILRERFPGPAME